MFYIKASDKHAPQSALYLTRNWVGLSWQSNFIKSLFIPTTFEVNTIVGSQDFKKIKDKLSSSFKIYIVTIMEQEQRLRI